MNKLFEALKNGSRTTKDVLRLTMVFGQYLITKILQVRYCMELINPTPSNAFCN